MNCVSPVIEGLEPYEVKIGGPDNGQPQFFTLHALTSPDGKVMSRWVPTEEERQQIAAGADIYLTIHANGIPYPPTQVHIQRADFGAEIHKINLALDDALDLRMLADDLQTSKRALDEKSAAFHKKAKEVCERMQLQLGNQTQAEGSNGPDR